MMNKINVNYPFGVHDLLTTIVVNMFSDFQNHLNSSDTEIDHNAKRNLIIKFQTVFDNIQTVNHRAKEYSSTIDELSDKASATRLDEHFRELVDLGNYEVVVKITSMLSLTGDDQIDIRRVANNWNLKFI